MGKFLITLFLGWSGIHKFMDGKIGMGILYLCTFGLCGIGWIIDIVIAAKNLHSSQFAIGDGEIKLKVVGTSYRKNDISSVMSGNRLYNLPDDAFMKKIAQGENIYRFKYRKADAVLVPEPTNPHDANAIKVMVDDIQVGYIPAEHCAELKKKLGKVKSSRVEIYGGDYRYHSNGEVFNIERDFLIDLYLIL